MEIQQFRYFLTAARYENLTKAAEELHIAQPALSQSVKRLETELGVSLFDRKNHRIELNEQGKLLKKRLIPLMESIDNLKDELWESVYSSEGTIYLNFLSASNLITNCIISYRAQKPDVQFQVSQLEMMENCDIHIESRIAMSVTPPHPQELPEGIVRREYLREEIFLAVPPDSKFAKHKTIDLREVKEENFIRLGNGWQLRMICDDFCRRAGIRPQAVFESNSPESVRNLVAAGLGIGFWPEKAWGGPPGHGVDLIPIRYPNCRRDLVVTMFEQAKDKPVVDEFMDYFCRYFEKETLESGDVTL